MTHTIVLAEDDQDVRELMRSVLESANVQVIETANGEQAMEVIRSRKVDILITDVRMPICDGAMLTRLAKTQSPGLNVVIITGYVDFDEQESQDLGADAFLRKPFETDSLVDVVNKLTKKRKAS